MSPVIGNVLLLRWGGVGAGVVFGLHQDGLLDLVDLEGFGQVCVHPGGEAALGILLKGVGRHGQDGDGLSVRPVHGPNGLRGGEAVHHRHHNVHEDGVEGARRVAPEGLDGLLPVADDGERGPLVREGDAHDLSVELVVVGQQQVQAPETGRGVRGRGRRHRLLRDGKGQRDDEGGADALGAADLDGPVHLFHQVLDDGHAQTGALSVGNVFLG